MKNKTNDRDSLLKQIRELTERLGEAEETLAAIRSGEVDAFVVSDASGEKVFTLKGAEHPYRVLVESMNEGAVTLSPEGFIIFANNRLIRMLKKPGKELIGTDFKNFVHPHDIKTFEAIFEKGMTGEGRGEIVLSPGAKINLPVHISSHALPLEVNSGICLIITDLTEQKINKEILASERLTRHIIEQAGEAIIVCNQNGEVIRASRPAQGFSGKNPVLKKFNQVFKIKTADGKKFFTGSKSLCQDEIRNAEVRMVGIEGKMWHLILNARPLTDLRGSNIGCVITLTDITERKLFEERIMESEQKYRAIIEDQTELLTRLKADGTLTFVNNAACRYFGLKCENFVGKSLMPFVHEEDREKVRRMINSLNRKNPIVTIEHRVNMPSGRINWMQWTNHALFDTKGRLNEIQAVGRDITELKATEEALARAFASSEFEKSRLETLIENIPSGVIIVEKPDGRINYVNEQALKIYGFDTLGMTLKEFSSKVKLEDLNGNPFPAEELPLFHALIHGRSVRDRELSLKHPDGRRIIINSNAAPIHDNKGKVISAVGIFYDITDRKKVEEILKRDKGALEKLVENKTRDVLHMRQEVERARRLSDIGTLSATVAHELRNPLAAIKTVMYNMKKKSVDPVMTKRIFDIESKIAESEQIISNLLFYSRLKMPHFAQVRLTDIIHQSLDEIKKRHEKYDVTVNKNPGPLLELNIEADPFQIKEVFMNIFNNAFDAIPEGKGTITITGNIINGSAGITIKDTGMGIEKHDLGRIFDPFFTTKAKGTGLGLTVCSQIVQLHNGTMDVTSEKGKGTTVTIVLPIERNGNEKKDTDNR